MGGQEISGREDRKFQEGRTGSFRKGGQEVWKGRCPSSPNFFTTARGTSLIPLDLTCTRPAYKVDLWWNRVTNLQITDSDTIGKCRLFAIFLK
ncbi:hypothetical protein AVEN_253031-1 [Araneus ventricosus]|uniref:Uncharacterized protein n=1 Tax=Araneus ventricosus TaxID=182803 RepID=A0A4Y2H7Y3_ARAVE|nr:hypothetical protein AVEN_253031-1 [Araneus ventricosus]